MSNTLARFAEQYFPAPSKCSREQMAERQKSKEVYRNATMDGAEDDK